MSALVFSPLGLQLCQFPKLKSSSTSRLNVHTSVSSFVQDRRYPFRSMADSVRIRATTSNEEVSVTMGGHEQEAFINESFISYPGSGDIHATLNSLSKWLVTAVFSIILLGRHDTVALWAASGFVLNAGLSTVLKRIINQERPVSAIRSGPGMPSSHAQSIFYSVTFCNFSMVEYFGLNGVTAAISALIFTTGFYFSWLRILQQHHTSNQVVVGITLGFSFFGFWFWLWDSIVLNAFASHLWVRIVLALGSGALCGRFLVYMIRSWVLKEKLVLL